MRGDLLGEGNSPTLCIWGYTLMGRGFGRDNDNREERGDSIHMLLRGLHHVITLHLHAFFVISVLVKITDITIFLGAQIDFCKVSSMIIFFSDQRLPAILLCFLVQGQLEQVGSN